MGGFKINPYVVEFYSFFPKTFPQYFSKITTEHFIDNDLFGNLINGTVGFGDDNHSEKSISSMCGTIMSINVCVCVYIYIYIYGCRCVSLCVCSWMGNQRRDLIFGIFDQHQSV